MRFVLPAAWHCIKVTRSLLKNPYKRSAARRARMYKYFAYDLVDVRAAASEAKKTTRCVCAMYMCVYESIT